MKLSFKNRIAVYYLAATAIIVAVVYLVVFFIVKNTVYDNLDHDLNYEAKKHTTEINIVNDSIYFINKGEWEEREHREAQVSPVFIQVMNSRGQLMDRSPNLKNQTLKFLQGDLSGHHFNSQLNHKAIRQVQIPIHQASRLKGFILAAMSMESSIMVIRNLRSVLFISYPLVLIGLFFVTRYLAGRSIVPVRNITRTTNRITNEHLNERVALPANRDELYELSTSINMLLQRIEDAIQRERQFTSDASHELRTPLAALRGNLEILVRKPREREEYEEKIKTSLGEIDRMSGIIGQLLLLARFDTAAREAGPVEKVSLAKLVDEVLSGYSERLATKELKVEVKADLDRNDNVPHYYAKLILGNVISNAIKYSHNGGQLIILLAHRNEGLLCEVRDEGLGIRKEDLDKLFQPFFRSDAMQHREIRGSGLGLSIVKKAADAIGASLQVESELGKGTRFRVIFPQA